MIRKFVGWVERVTNYERHNEIKGVNNGRISITDDIEAFETNLRLSLSHGKAQQKFDRSTLNEKIELSSVNKQCSSNRTYDEIKKSSENEYCSYDNLELYRQCLNDQNPDLYRKMSEASRQLLQIIAYEKCMDICQSSNYHDKVSNMPRDSFGRKSGVSMEIFHVLKRKKANLDNKDSEKQCVRYFEDHITNGKKSGIFSALKGSFSKRLPITLSSGESSKSVVSQKLSNEDWTSRTEFLFTCVALTISYPSIYSLPELLGRYGVVFLLPLFVCTAFMTCALLKLEFCISQISRGGFIKSMACINERCIGVAIGAILFTCLRAIDTIRLVACNFSFFLKSFSEELPWEISYNCIVHKTENECISASEYCTWLRVPKLCKPQYLKRAGDFIAQNLNFVLNMFDDLKKTKISWELIVIIIFIWIITFFLVSRGLGSLRRFFLVICVFVGSFTIVLFGMFLVNKSMPQGFRFLFGTALKFSDVVYQWDTWTEAFEVSCDLFMCSSGICFILSSHTPVMQNVVEDCFWISIVSCIGTFLFSVIFFIGCVNIGLRRAHKLSRPFVSGFFSSFRYNFRNTFYTVDLVPAILLYPPALTFLSNSSVASVLFFFGVTVSTLMTIVFYTSTVISAFLESKYIYCKIGRVWISFFFCCCFLLCSVPLMQKDGFAKTSFITSFSKRCVFHIFVFFECFSAGWFYGYDIQRNVLQCGLKPLIIYGGLLGCSIVSITVINCLLESTFLVYLSFFLIIFGWFISVVVSFFFFKLIKKKNIQKRFTKDSKVSFGSKFTCKTVQGINFKEISCFDFNTNALNHNAVNCKKPVTFSHLNSDYSQSFSPVYNVFSPSKKSSIEISNFNSISPNESVRHKSIKKKEYLKKNTLLFFFLLFKKKVWNFFNDPKNNNESFNNFFYWIVIGNIFHLKDKLNGRTDTFADMQSTLNNTDDNFFLRNFNGFKNGKKYSNILSSASDFAFVSFDSYIKKKTKMYQRDFIRKARSVESVRSFCSPEKWSSDRTKKKGKSKYSSLNTPSSRQSTIRKRNEFNKLLRKNYKNPVVFYNDEDEKQSDVIISENYINEGSKKTYCQKSYETINTKTEEFLDTEIPTSSIQNKKRPFSFFFNTPRKTTKNTKNTKNKQNSIFDSSRTEYLVKLKNYGELKKKRNCLQIIFNTLRQKRLTLGIMWCISIKYIIPIFCLQNFTRTIMGIVLHRKNFKFLLKKAYSSLPATVVITYVFIFFCVFPILSCFVFPNWFSSLLPPKDHIVPIAYSPSLIRRRGLPSIERALWFFEGIKSVNSIFGASIFQIKSPM